MSERFDIDDLRKTFRALRRKKRITQAEAAAALRITQGAISAFELGKSVSSSRQHCARDFQVG